MSNFWRRAKEPVPPDVAFLDQRAWSHFVSVVENDLRTRGLTFRRNELTIEILGKPSSMHGLLNLAQVCARRAHSEWIDIVRSWFDSLLPATRERVEQTLFDNVRQHLKVRLFPSDFAAGTDADLITRPFAHDILAAIAIDLPTVVQTATSKAMAQWQITPDELFELGFQNVRLEGAPTMKSVKTNNGVDVLVFEMESFFTATWVKWLGELVEPPEEGAIVGLPTRHMIIAHLLRDSSAARAVNSMIPLIRSVYDLGPGSLSRHLYWWVGGELRWLPAHMSEERIEFYPPNDFVDAVTRVSGNS